MDGERFLGRPILDGAAVFGQPFHERHQAVARALFARHRINLPGHESAPAGAALAARVHEGYWIVDCPTCPSAELAWRDDPRFLCTNCVNQANGGQTWPVVFPRQIDAIEAVLRLRPNPATRNWLPGETLAALRRENRDHGIPDR
jgi:hypothetical protein